jgi:hypothetical protein
LVEVSLTCFAPAGKARVPIWPDFKSRSGRLAGPLVHSLIAQKQRQSSAVGGPEIEWMEAVNVSADGYRACPFGQAPLLVIKPRFGRTIFRLACISARNRTTLKAEGHGPL